MATDRCRHVRWGAIGILWVFALWHSWEVRALFNDGAVFFIATVHQQSPVHFYAARDYAMLAMQFPLTLALRLGVTDLNWLARLLSFGMFALPTAIYHLALVRAREDAALLAAVIIAIAAIFMTTSFSIVGEYNTAYALAVLAAVLLASNVRPSVIDALLLVAIAAFALRVYETFVFLGPALAAMALWTVRRGPCPGVGFPVSGVLRAALLAGFMAVVCLASLIGRYAIFLPLGLILVVAATWAVVRVSARPLVANGLVVLAAALFAASAAVAVQSLVFYVEPDRLEHAALSSLGLNIQFDLAVGSVLVVAVWALARPDDLATNKPYRWAGVGLVLLAVSPLMTLAGQTVGDHGLRSRRRSWRGRTGRAGHDFGHVGVSIGMERPAEGSGAPSQLAGCAPPPHMGPPDARGIVARRCGADAGHFVLSTGDAKHHPRSKRAYPF